jgi:hypothetical protein
MIIAVRHTAVISKKRSDIRGFFDLPDYTIPIEELIRHNTRSRKKSILVSHTER